MEHYITPQAILTVVESEQVTIGSRQKSIDLSRAMFHTIRGDLSAMARRLQPWRKVLLGAASKLSIFYILEIMVLYLLTIVLSSTKSYRLSPLPMCVYYLYFIASASLTVASLTVVSLTAEVLLIAIFPPLNLLCSITKRSNLLINCRRSRRI